jgi:pyruvate,orthophosphate dikinase
MPGMLDTFLNVGINQEIAEGFADMSGRPWAAWDAYRRFLQFWGMSQGVDRDVFDTLMRDAKQKFSVAKKSLLSAPQMQDLALRYRQLLMERGVEIVDDPFAQLEACIDLVIQSWHSAKARAYRSAMQIAEEWGTAVVVQKMVYGNLHERSGTGAVLTREPRRITGGVQLYGDFVVQGQGDDVVSGLVETFPITEQQRLSESTQADISLQKDFPGIYAALARHANSLIRDHEMFHQEIEFTFESEDPQDLYILQTRNSGAAKPFPIAAFVPGERLDAAKVATGIGAAGGALAGRVAHTAQDIAELRERFPADPIILLRPDTVPDDLPLILQADGMLTAIGGATSHAAVGAQRLGRTCVVGCRALDVDEEGGRSKLAGRPIRTGDFLSINGIDGSVYLGKHPFTIVRREPRA